MTEAQFMVKYQELMPRVIEGLQNKAKELVASGAVDIESYEDNFLLPKIILAASLTDEAYQWTPPDKGGKAIVRKLAHF